MCKTSVITCKRVKAISTIINTIEKRHVPSKCGKGKGKPFRKLNLSPMTLFCFCRNPDSTKTYNSDELSAAVFLSFSSFPVIFIYFFPTNPPVIFNSFNLFQEPTSVFLWGRTCKQRLGFVHQVVTQKRTRPKPPIRTPRTSLCCFCRGVLGVSSVCSAYGTYYLLT